MQRQLDDGVRKHCIVEIRGIGQESLGTVQGYDILEFLVIICKTENKDNDGLFDGFRRNMDHIFLAVTYLIKVQKCRTADRSNLKKEGFNPVVTPVCPLFSNTNRPSFHIRCFHFCYLSIYLLTLLHFTLLLFYQFCVQHFILTAS